MIVTSDFVSGSLAIRKWFVSVLTLFTILSSTHSVKFELSTDHYECEFRKIQF